MKNINFELTDGQTINLPTPVSVATRTVKTNLRTPVELTNEGIQHCSTEEDAIKVIAILCFILEWRFRHNNKLFLPKVPIFEAVTEEQLEFDEEDLLAKIMQPVKLFYDQMINSNTKITVVSEETVRKAVSMVKLWVEVKILSKYGHKLPNGKEQLAAADMLFEEMCAKNKVGRRTRAIIARNAGTIVNNINS